MKQSINKSKVLATGFALVGLIVYLITSYTGYLASSPANIWPILMTVIAIGLLLVTSVDAFKWEKGVKGIISYLTMDCLLIAFYFFVQARVSLAADVYFIPVNYPHTEAIAIQYSFVGIGLYVLAILTLIIEAFRGKSN